MNKKLLTLLAAALLCSCSDGVLDSERAQDAKPKLYVALTDYSDGTPIASASLNLQSAGRTAKTSEDGIAVFEKINVGTHLLRIEAEGYATALVTAEVDEITRAGESGRITRLDMPLFHKSATLEGYVQHTDSKGQKKGLVGLPVRIVFDGDCKLAEPATDTVLTDSEGKFKFENLPAVNYACPYTIQTTGAEIGGKTYSAGQLLYSGNNYRLIKGEKTTIDNRIQPDRNIDVDIFQLLSYNRDISYGQETTPIVFTFSENIAANQQGNVTIPYSDVGYNVEIKDNTITVKPASKWEEGSFYLGFSNLRSESGKIIDLSYVVVNVLSKDISGLKVEGLQLNPSFYNITYSAYSAPISFKKIEGATGYRYYLLENGRLFETRCSDIDPSSTQSVLSVTCNIAISDSNATNSERIGDNTNKLIVQAYNAQYESQKSDTLLIKETKPEAPKLASGIRICAPYIENDKILVPYNNCYYRYQSDSQYPWDYVGNSRYIMEALGDAAASAEEYSGDVYFSRAMSKTQPTFECAGTAGVCGRLGITFKWLNEQLLWVKVKVNAGDALASDTYVSTNITIKGLTGANNIPFTDGALTPSSNLVVKLEDYIP